MPVKHLYALCLCSVCAVHTSHFITGTVKLCLISYVSQAFMAVCVSDNLLGNTADLVKPFWASIYMVMPGDFFCSHFIESLNPKRKQTWKQSDCRNFSVFKLGNFRTSLLEKLPLHWEQQTYVTFLCAGLLWIKNVPWLQQPVFSFWELKKKDFWLTTDLF